MTLRLVIQPLPGASFEHIIEGEEATIGRSSSCDLTLPHRYLSRRQARIFRHEGALFLEDLGSHNGTRLNGAKIETPTSIAPGDVISLPGFQVTVHEWVPTSLLVSSSSVAASSVSRV